MFGAIKGTLGYIYQLKLFSKNFSKCGNFDPPENAENLPITQTVPKCTEYWKYSTPRNSFHGLEDRCEHHIGAVPFSSDNYFERNWALFSQLFSDATHILGRDISLCANNHLWRKELRILTHFPLLLRKWPRPYGAHIIQVLFGWRISFSNCSHRPNTPVQLSNMWYQDSTNATKRCFWATTVNIFVNTIGYWVGCTSVDILSCNSFFQECIVRHRVVFLPCIWNKKVSSRKTRYK